MSINCPHCKPKRVELKRENNGALKCPECGCVFRLAVCHWLPECFAKHHPDYGKRKETLKEMRKKKRKKRK